MVSMLTAIRVATRSRFAGAEGTIARWFCVAAAHSRQFWEHGIEIRFRDRTVPRSPFPVTDCGPGSIVALTGGFSNGHGRTEAGTGNGEPRTGNLSNGIIVVSTGRRAFRP